ncbi:hypothetical protein Tco_1139391, partial [Tanacetum coccineum]
IDVDDTATTPAPVEFEPAEQEESDPFEQEESEPAEQEESDHEASSHKTATPPTTATYYRCTPIDSPGPRPLMVRSPHVLPGTPVGFASGLNQFEKNMIRELTKVANTARYLLDLQEDTMSGVWGNIYRMDTQMTWMQCDYREARAERRNAWCFDTTCTDISKITRKPSKTGKHEHGKRKSTKEAKDSEAKPRKVNSQST